MEVEEGRRMLKLVIEDDEGKQTIVPLIRDEITIGRKEGNTIRLTERNVSRRHARLTKLNGGIFVEDVASRYGTKLNGSKIDSREKFDLPDEVLIGDYKLRIQDDTKPPEEDQSTQIKDMQALQDAAGPQPIPPQQQGRLVVISSNFAGQEFPLARTEMVIGRSDECDIIIDHMSISGKHAKIVRSANGIFKVLDLKSANGVKVNFTPYSIKELGSGEIIDLGHVRFRFCAPGDLWSFTLAAGLMEDNIQPPGGKGKLFILLAVIAALVVGLAAFMILRPQPETPQQAAEKAETQQETVETKRDTAPAISGVPTVDRSIVDELVLLCDEHAEKGEFEAALDACKQAQSKDPGNKYAQAKYDRIIAELALKKHYDSAINYLDLDECELALVEIDSVNDENSWTARQILKEGLRTKSVKCIESGIVTSAEAAIEESDFDTAQNKIDELRDKVSTSTQIARLEESLVQAQKKKDRPKNDDPKPKKDKDPVKDKAEDPPAKGGGDPAEAEELADEAKKLILSNPSKAADLYKAALKISPNNAKWRGSYAYALERAGKICPAYDEYKKAVGKLSGSSKERAQMGIEKYQGQCE